MFKVPLFQNECLSSINVNNKLAIISGNDNKFNESV